MNKQDLVSPWRLLMVLVVTLLTTVPLLAQTCNDAILQSAPDSRYQDHGDGTVTDLNTGLMWKQCSQGQSGAGCATGTEVTITGDVALQQGEILNSSGGFAGYSDWRLPNRKELESLVEVACYSPAINITLFPNTPNYFYWSSTQDLPDSGFVWGVSFEEGLAFRSYFNVGLPVRLVRSGQ